VDDAVHVLRAGAASQPRTGARVRRSARPAGVRTRYRLSNSSPLGLGLDVSTGTSVPATSCGVSSTQSWIMSGYLPACVAGVGLLPSAVPVHASCARQGRDAWQKAYERNGAQAKDVYAREPAVRSRSGRLLLAEPAIERWDSHAADARSRTACS